MTFTPHLYFDGTCAEAMTFYADLFGAGDLQIMRFSDASGETGLPSSDRVMHAQFSAGGHALMGSDVPPGTPYQPQTSVAITHTAPDTETGQVLFDRLADGGEVTMPFAPSFFAPAFGMVTDRFGTHWMIIVMPG